MSVARAGLVLAIVLLTTALAASAAAQTTSSFAELQRQLKPEQTVYIQTAEVTDEYGRGIKGKVLELSGSTLRLLVKGQRREFSERDVLVLSERHTSARKGALIGLAVGGAAGLWFNGTLRREICQNCAFEAQDLGLVGLVAGWGTALGAAIGGSVVHERVLFLAPELRQTRAFRMGPLIGSRHRGLAATFRF